MRELLDRLTALAYLHPSEAQHLREAVARLRHLDQVRCELERDNEALGKVVESNQRTIADLQVQIAVERLRGVP